MRSFKDFDVVIVGAGFFGLTAAHEIVQRTNKRVIVLEKRDHIGGNAYSYFDDSSGIEIHKYGTHIFHTSNQKVIEFISKFAQFNNYHHKVKTNYKNQVYTLPINLHTLSQFFGKTFSPVEAKEFFQNIPKISSEVRNFQDAAINSVGEELYQAFFEGYTKKQWGLSPSDIPAEVFARLPIRFNFDDNYFSDTLQGVPINGYGALFDRIVDHKRITVEVDFEFHNDDFELLPNQKLIYSGPIDRFFNYKYGVLNWRTLDFEIEHLNLADYQGTAVMNFAETNIPFTRIHEFKHLNPERKQASNQTVIMKEYSRFATDGDDFYYPVNTPDDRSKLAQYRELSKQIPNVHFGGRLGRYQYLDMHMAIANSISLVEQILD